MAVSVPQHSLHQWVVSAHFDPALFAIYTVGCFQLPIVDLLYTPTTEVLMVHVGELAAGGPPRRRRGPVPGRRLPAGLRLRAELCLPDRGRPGLHRGGVRDQVPPRGAPVPGEHPGGALRVLPAGWTPPRTGGDARHPRLLRRQGSGHRPPGAPPRGDPRAARRRRLLAHRRGGGEGAPGADGCHERSSCGRRGSCSGSCPSGTGSGRPSPRGSPWRWCWSGIGPWPAASSSCLHTFFWRLFPVGSDALVFGLSSVDGPPRAGDPGPPDPLAAPAAAPGTGARPSRAARPRGRGRGAGPLRRRAMGPSLVVLADFTPRGERSLDVLFVRLGRRVRAAGWPVRMLFYAPPAPEFVRELESMGVEWGTAPFPRRTDPPRFWTAAGQGSRGGPDALHVTRSTRCSSSSGLDAFGAAPEMVDHAGNLLSPKGPLLLAAEGPRGRLRAGWWTRQLGLSQFLARRLVSLGLDPAR